MVRFRAAGLSLVVLLALSSAATAGEALGRIERILMVAQDFDHGMPPSADLTAEVNALLAMPTEQVLGALRAALDHGRLDGSIAQTFVPLVVDLARFLTASPRGPADEVKPLVFEIAGVVVLRGDPRRGSFAPREVPRLADVVGKEPKLRSPLNPDGAKLLGRILAKPDALDLEDAVLRDSHAAGVHFAASKDAELLGRLCRAVERSDPTSPTAGILAHALARQIGPRPPSALAGLLERAVAADTTTVGEIARALRNGNRPEILTGLRVTLAEADDPAALRRFDEAAGPWLVLYRLAFPGSPGTVDALERLAAAARSAGPLALRDTWYRVLYHACIDEDTSPEVAAAMSGLARILHWPAWYGRTEATVVRPGRAPIGITIAGLGGYPATDEVADTIFTGLDDIHLRWSPHPFTPVAADPLSPRRDYVLADRPSDGVDVTARLAGPVVRVVIRNTGEKPLFVNPNALRHSALRSVTVQETRDGAEATSRELHLTAGALGYGLQTCFDPDEAIRIAPGRARTFTLPLPGPVPGLTRVFVEFLDTSSKVFGLPPDARVLRSFRGVPAVRDDRPLTSADRKARDVLDRIVRIETEAGDAPDLAAAADELLALGEGPVARAFRDALDRGCRPGTWAADRRYTVLSLASALRNVPPYRTGLPVEVEHGFRNLAGNVVFVDSERGFTTGPPPTHVHPPGLTVLGGGFPTRLSPDANALIERLLAPDETVKRWLGTEPFDRTVTRALVGAGRRDPSVAKRILQELDARAFDPDAWDPTGILLAQAAGRLGGEEARRILREKFAGQQKDGAPIGLWGHVFGLARALRSAGCGDELLAMGPRLRPYLDGEFVVPFLLSEAEREPSTTRLRELRAELMEYTGRRPRPETHLRILALALERMKDGDPAARELLSAVVWPHTGHSVSSSWFGHWNPEYGGPPAERISVDEKGRWISGWPDPDGSARWLGERIREGSIRLMGTSPVRRSLFADGPDGKVDGQPVHRSVEFRPVRDGDRLRIHVTNRASGSICVNPMAFRLANAEVLEVTEERDGTVTRHPAVRLCLGVAFPWNVSVVRPDQFDKLKPGETREFVFALAKGLPGNTKITVRFEDPFVIDGPLPWPRLARVEDVEVK